MFEDVEAGKRDLSVLRIPRENEARPRSGSWGWWAVAASCLLAGAAGYLGYRTWKSERPVEVETAVIRVEESSVFTTLLDARGYVEPERKAEVAPRTQGILGEVRVREGMTVREGDLLAELKNDDLQAQKIEAEVVLRYAQVEREAQRKLWADGRATAEKAVRDAERDVEVAEAKVRYLEALIENTRVRAPFAGRITRRYLNPGDTAGPSGAVATLVDFESLVLVVDVNQSDLSRLDGAERAEIRIEGIERPYEGKILWKVPTAERVKGIVPVKVSIENRDEVVLPQMSARVTFQGRAGKGRRMVVPEGAERGGTVLVVENGRATKVDVSALHGGEEVVLRPEGLLDGRTVRRR